jgi:hypothetical protein
MATIERTVSALSFEVNELSDRAISLRVTFDDGTGDDWIISVPRMELERLRILFRELEYSLSPEIEGDDPVRDLIAEKNYTVRVQR